MSAFIENVAGQQVVGATEGSTLPSLTLIRLGPAIILLLPVMAMTLPRTVFPTRTKNSNSRGVR